MGGELVAGGE
jgi:hypothetical protein